MKRPGWPKDALRHVPNPPSPTAFCDYVTPEWLHSKHAALLQAALHAQAPRSQTSRALQDQSACDSSKFCIEHVALFWHVK